MRLFLFVSQYLVLALLYYFLLQVVTVVHAGLHESASGGKAETDAKRKHGSSPRPMLVVVQGSAPRTGERYLISGTAVIMGRGSGNDIVLGDPFASKQHARVYCTQGQVWVEDLHSSNGTFVNGRRVSEKVRLKSGDRVEIGDTVLSLEFAR